VRRYWYADSVSDIAARMNGDSRRISVRLFRIREKLYRYLKKEGLLE
jgi:RNA polymerase sigma-70 factor (ECF subfamily)